MLRNQLFIFIAHELEKKGAPDQPTFGKPCHRVSRLYIGGSL